MTTPQKSPKAPLKLSDYLGRQITLAIVTEQGHQGNPEISLFIGLLSLTDKGFEIAPTQGPPFRIPTNWLPRVATMDESIRPILGGSDLLLSIPSHEFERAGFSFTTAPTGAIDFIVERTREDH